MIGLVAVSAVIGLGTASGRAGYQSPINITSSNTLYDPGLPGLAFNYSQSVAVEVHNTGSPDEEATIKGYVLPGAGSVTVQGVAYELLQFHFHLGAEHLVNGGRGAMEVHFVHQSLANEFLVVGQIVQIGATNANLAAIFSDLPVDHDDIKTLTGFNLNALLPSTLTSFRYEGSLTTSPYTEGVRWNVLTTPTTVSQEQFDAYFGLFPDGDARDVQDFGGWVVTDLDGFSAVPEPSLSGFFGVVALGVVWRARRTRYASAPHRPGVAGIRGVFGRESAWSGAAGLR